MVNSYGANQKTIKLYHILNGKVKGGATPQKIKRIAFQPRKCYNIRVVAKGAKRLRIHNSKCIT